MYRGKRKVSEFASLNVAASCTRKSFTHKGRTRGIVIPSDKLRGCHEFIRLFLLDFLPVEIDLVFSYRKGVGAFDAVKQHASSRHFFVTDIADFFPSIKRDRVLSIIQTGRGISPISDLDAWMERIVELVCLDGELPVGFSTSPAISNAALRPFDQAMRKECGALGLVYTRYSDDLVISGGDAGVVERAQAFCECHLREAMHGEFQLRPEKSKFLHVGRKIKLLGMVLLPNGRISIDGATKSEIEVLLHFYLRDRAKFAAMGEGDERKVEARLAGLLNYANTVDQSYLDKLRHKFGAAPIDLFIHRSFG
ncbi:reverse transcriptase family protein [Ramlibacter monticola]|nr:reverse transcriptase domain-containing protein [Ramlibacter monticola]